MITGVFVGGSPWVALAGLKLFIHFCFGPNKLVFAYQFCYGFSCACIRPCLVTDRTNIWRDGEASVFLSWTLHEQVSIAFGSVGSSAVPLPCLSTPYSAFEVGSAVCLLGSTLGPLPCPIHGGPSTMILPCDEPYTKYLTSHN